jgi:hypothetical protein
MANAVDRAPIGPARCALTLLQVQRRIAEIERQYTGDWGEWDLLKVVADVWSDPSPLDQYKRLRCASGLLEAALRWQFESLHTAALETVTPCAGAALKRSPWVK